MKEMGNGKSQPFLHGKCIPSNTLLNPAQRSAGGQFSAPNSDDFLHPLLCLFILNTHLVKKKEREREKEKEKERDRERAEERQK